MAESIDQPGPEASGFSSVDSLEDQAPQFEAVIAPVGTDLVASDSEVRRLVDPDSTLPQVTLRVTNSEIHADWYNAREQFSIIVDGQLQGYGDLVTDDIDDKGTTTEKRQHFDYVTLDKLSRSDNRRTEEVPHRDRPKGLGLAVYLVAIETAMLRGQRFESQDGPLSKGSVRIWQILVDHGVAEVVKTPVEEKYGDHSKYFAKYVVRPERF